MGTCALVGAAYFNAPRFIEMDDAGFFDYVIAVDGGYESLMAIDRKPDLALGDFDSLGYVPKGCRYVRYPSAKAKSDFELGIDRARALHHDTIVAFGVLGGRLDQTLATLQVLVAASKSGQSVSAIGETECVFVLNGPDVFEAAAQQSGTVSVFSLSDESIGVFERGLRWELDDIVLTSTTSLGLSNEFCGEAIMIGVEKGVLAIVMQM